MGPIFGRGVASRAGAVGAVAAAVGQRSSTSGRPTAEAFQATFYRQKAESKSSEADQGMKNVQRLLAESREANRKANELARKARKERIADEIEAKGAEGAINAEFRHDPKKRESLLAGLKGHEQGSRMARHMAEVQLDIHGEFRSGEVRLSHEELLEGVRSRGK